VRWTRFPALVAALVTTAFQVLTEGHAMPAAALSPPWLDGRPTLQLLAPGPTWRPGGSGFSRFVRFDAGMGPRYGVLEEERVHAIAGDLFGMPAPTGWTHALDDVRLLTPLGPDVFHRAVWLGEPSATGVSPAQALARLDASALSGPGDRFPLPVACTIVRPALGVLVGGSPGAPEAFGVTAGLVAYASPERPRLALGPCVARGLEVEELGGVGHPGGGGPRPAPPGAASLERMRALLDARRVTRGDVLLLPLGPGGPARNEPQQEPAIRLNGVGELRCGLSV